MPPEGGTSGRLTAHVLRRAGGWTGPAFDRAILTAEERFLRRRVLTLARSGSLLVDLADPAALVDGDALETTDGRLVEVVAAPEPLAEITAPPEALLRIAWHVGNRHTPCQIAPARLLIRRDHVIEAMVAGLGARLVHVVEPFSPEGGAYGPGRVLGHDHPHDHG
ncbi:MAG TPA: urease accessory protein UreE [Paracoccaceae bacterium]|nr:urease accessory protein UreE [Paracoccaceae bacterium]